MIVMLNGGPSCLCLFSCLREWFREGKSLFLGRLHRASCLIPHVGRNILKLRRVKALNREIRQQEANTGAHF